MDKVGLYFMYFYTSVSSCFLQRKSLQIFSMCPYGAYFNILIQYSTFFASVYTVGMISNRPFLFPLCKSISCSSSLLLMLFQVLSQNIMNFKDSHFSYTYSSTTPIYPSPLHLKRVVRSHSCSTCLSHRREILLERWHGHLTNGI